MRNVFVLTLLVLLPTLSMAAVFVARGNLKPIEIPIKPVEQEEPRWYLQLDGGTPLRRVLFQEGITQKYGPGDLWICTDPDCPEGCNSQPPELFGNGLILEESRKLEAKQKKK